MDTKQIKNKLLAQRAELLRRVAAIKADFAQGKPADFSEQTTESENDDVLRSLRLEAETEIRQINRALEQIDAGEYGTCERCGDAIPAGRLEAIPEATLCTRCA
ncbi:TraR/DksA C4-type zinc finger protein [Pseudomaricurvus sp. HS19]|uniref:TraR/DksA family transcriptional regulator n=1 Tax=Pseudomaricurvus sp. HS19 TaxID=2692626 RepID=UPI00136BC23F|nr:TraR/DksA C4-type zinc finger protein [Pseudomaricurvus sp. HS19]MYM62058.1 TraR/DksA family transcriptional regulator [Pseudomaricurvus sp. HS19]